LVDDGSTDDSGTICDEYAAKDHRIRVIHQANHGVSAARNRGLQVARGKYFVVPDPDDYVEPTYLEDLIRPTLEFDYDIVFSGHTITNNELTSIEPCEDYTATDYQSFLRLICEDSNRYILRSHWTALYKLNIVLIYSIVYPSITWSEDVLFLLEYLSYSRTGCSISKNNYHYVRRQHSLSHLLNLENSSKWAKAMQQLIIRYNQRQPNPIFVHYLETNAIDAIDRTINIIYREIKNKQQRISELNKLPLSLYKRKEPASWRSRLLKFLLVNRRFYIYDFIWAFFIRHKT
jgi:glycosyltransferase involved in cell wall biosynthesis